MDKFEKIQKYLNKLGYDNVLTNESVPLVEQLLTDLKTTTESLHKYLKHTQQALEERNSLQLIVDQYKCDNNRLIRECNDLHLAFVQFKEQNEKIKTDLKQKIISLERFREAERDDSKTKLRSDSNLKFSAAMAQAEEKILYLTEEIRKLKQQQLQMIESNDNFQKQLEERDKEIKQLRNGKSGNLVGETSKCCRKSGDNKQNENEIKSLQSDNNMLQTSLREALTKQHEAMRRALYLAERNKQLEQELKDIDQMALAVEAECNTTIKENVDKVVRLQDKVSESAIIIQNLERQVAKLTQDKLELNADLDVVKMEKRNLRIQLDTEIEDNKQLTDKINRFTIIEHDLNLEIDRLSKLSAEQKRKIADLEGRVSYPRISKEFDDVTRNRTKPSDRDIGTDVPKSLPRVADDSFEAITQTDPCKTLKSKSRKKEVKRKSLPKRVSSSLEKTNSKTSKRIEERTSALDSLPLRDASSQIDLSERCCPNCLSTVKEILNREMDLRQMQIVQNLEQLKEEKEYYMKEYLKFCGLKYKCSAEDGDLTSDHNEDKDMTNSLKAERDRYKQECLDLKEELHQLKEKFDIDIKSSEKLIESLMNEKEYYIQAQRKNSWEKSTNGNRNKDKIFELTETINYKNKEIESLQTELKILKEEKATLLRKMESREVQAEIKLNNECEMCKQKNRELEMLRKELAYVQAESDNAKSKVQSMSNSSLMEQNRLQKAFKDLEEKLQNLEQERRDLMQTENIRKSSVSKLEAQLDILQEQLRATQTDLTNQRASYNQLKCIHEQTDKTLADTQAKLLEAESNLAGMKTRFSTTQRESVVQDNELTSLKSDVRMLKNQLTKLDNEKDQLLTDLDEKTERIATLEEQLKTKNNQLSVMEVELNDLKRKLSKSISEVTSQNSILNSARSEKTILQKQLEDERKTRESAFIENKRLQNEVYSLTCDCRETRKELEICQRQNDDMKRQLQHYIAEVKRTEDLINQKELERNEILDQFKSLSQEANMLECNNHSLENAATQSRVQLSVALEHAADLETKLDSHESLVSGYEKQIAELTCQVANMEIQLKDGSSQQNRFEADLKRLRDLCCKLDNEKDTLQRKLLNKNESELQIQRSLDRLSEENLELHDAIRKDRESREGLEKLLNQARQEIIEERLRNQDFQGEINRLKNKVDELQRMLSTTTEQLEMYQSKALDYSQENKQLRMDIANERLCKDRGDDDRRYPSF